MSQNQDPVRHHFLPVFYLKKWCGEDGKLVQFSKPFNNVIQTHWRHPKATGFINRLYAIEGLPGELSYEIEKDFLSPVDSRAAIALTHMLARREPSAGERTAFARFVVSLLMRMPTEISLLKELISSIEARLAEGLERMVT